MCDLLSEIELFIVTTGVTASAVGKGAVKDAKLVFELRGGREVRSATAQRVRRWMAQQRAERPHAHIGGSGDGPAV